jgi:acyl dehydratase
MSDTAPAPLRPTTIAELRALVGVDLGPTEWYDVDQARVDAFAENTEDRQWIHVDPERAAASPFGGTIGHGLLTLSLGPKFMEELMAFDGFAHSLNYGYDKVRFPAPMPVGTRLRMHATITGVEDVGGGAQVTTTQTFEREGGEKPVCVAISVGRFVEHETAA